MYLKFIILFLFLSFLKADNNRSLFDEYHKRLCHALVNISNGIDDYFVDINSTKTSKTDAEFTTSVAQESGMDLEKEIRFRIGLNLPKIEESLRLVFEDDSSDNLLYNGTRLNNQKMDTKAYYLRLEYLNYVKEAFNMRLGTGMKIRKGNLVPYLNVQADQALSHKNNNKAELFNRFRYYSDGEIENNFGLNVRYTFQDNLEVLWNNSFYYVNSTPYEVLANDVTLLTSFNDKQHIRYGLGISSHIKKFENLKVDYYYLQATFRHLFYKKWVYYEVSPSILKREINDFKPSYRLLLNFGIYFKKY